jgi:tRNA(Ile)-lysidine synthase
VKRQCVAVAVSGGRDSTALWHATARAAAGTSLQVIALHVHHGLQPEADSWVRHLQRQARRWASSGLPVSLRWRRLQGGPASGDSVEAWARRERYSALTEMARECGAGLVLLAHHRSDQAETFLLQALRGAGPAGLAAMPREVQRHGIVWVRPWLQQSRHAIEAYLRRHRLSFVEDLSNSDRLLARNRLRLEVWPTLATSFEYASVSLAASARRAHEAAEGLRELAALDAQLACSVPGQLDVLAWLQLSAARRANLLRTWLSGQGDAGVPETLVQRLLQELPVAPSGAVWLFAGGQLRLHAGRLQAWEPAGPLANPGAVVRIDLSRAGRFAVPAWRGSFEVMAVPDGGLAPRRLRDCELRGRCGGEQFQRSLRSLPRSLKKQFQAAGLAAWQRGGPLVYGGGELLYVPGLGIDARVQAHGDVPMLGLRWLPEAD